MAITNTTKPSGSMTNTAKVSFAELWSTILTTWASETRTWLETGSLISNDTRVTTSITNTAKPS